MIRPDDLSAGGGAVLERVRADTDGARPPAMPAAMPFKELNYYEETDRRTFAGRDADIQRILASVETQRLLVLYGKSGLGKTSLLLAGAFPLLRERGFQPVYVRTLEEPLNDLAAAVARDCGIESGPAQGIRALLAEAGKHNTLVLVFDQFEEFLIRFKQRTRDRMLFVREISGLLLDQSSDCRVVFSLREDHLAALNEFQRRLPDLFSHALRLAPLTAMGAREAIVRPLDRDGITYDERLVTRLVDELAHFDCDSARLQVTCGELYRVAVETHEDSRRLELSDFNRLAAQIADDRSRSTPAGGLESATPLGELASVEGAQDSMLLGVFRSYVQKAVQQLSTEDQGTARALLDETISLHDTKYALTVEELKSRTAATPEQVDLILKLLGKPEEDQWPPPRQLLRTEERGGAPWVEIIHESLVPEIMAWLEQDEEFRKFRLARTLIVNNSLGNLWREKHGLLLSDDQLTEWVHPNRALLRLDAEKIEYVLRSAIRHGNSDAGYWWNRYAQLEKAVRTEGPPLQTPSLILLDLLRHENSDVRRGAAEAANFCPAPGIEVRGKLEDLAFSSRQPEPVRRAASQSLVNGYGAWVVEMLAGRLKWFGTAEPTLSVLGDLKEAGQLKGLSWYWRARARRVWARHKVTDFIASHPDAAGGGIVAGAAAGIGWPVTTGGIAVAMFIWALAPQAEWDEPWYFLVALWVGLAIIPCLIFGAMFGWMAERAGLQSLALKAARKHTQADPSREPKHHWGKVIMNSWMIPLFCWLILGACWELMSQGIAMVADTELEMAHTAGVIASLASALTAWLVSALAVSGIQVCMSRHPSPKDLILSQICSGWAMLTPLVFLPILACSIAAERGSTFFDDLSDNGIGIVIQCGSAAVLAWVIALVASCVLVRQESRLGASWTGPEQERMGLRWRWLLPAALLWIPVFYFGFGPHASPLLPQAVALGENASGQTFTVERDRMFSTNYVALKSGRKLGSLIELDISEPLHSELTAYVHTVGFGWSYASLSRVWYAADGRCELAVTGWDLDNDSTLTGTAKILQVQPAPFNMSPLPGAPQFVLVAGGALSGLMQAEAKQGEPPPAEGATKAAVRPRWSFKLDGTWKARFPEDILVVAVSTDSAWPDGLRSGAYEITPEGGTTWLDLESSDDYGGSAHSQSRTTYVRHQVGVVSLAFDAYSFVPPPPKDGNWKVAFQMVEMSEPRSERTSSSRESPPRVAVKVGNASSSQLISRSHRLDSERRTEEGLKLCLGALEAGVGNMELLMATVDLFPKILWVLHSETDTKSYDALKKRVGRQARAFLTLYTGSSNQQAQHDLTNALTRAGFYQEAYEWTMKVHPGGAVDDDALADIVTASGRVGKTEEAIALAKTYLDEEPDNMERMRILADAFSVAGKRDEAVRLRQKLVDMDREDLRNRENLVYELVEAGRNGEALEVAETMSNEQGDDAGAGTWDALATALNANERFAEAEDAARSAVEFESDNAGYHGEIAVAVTGLARQGLRKWRQALAEWNKVLEMAPDFFERSFDGLAQMRRPLYELAVLEAATEELRSQPLRKGAQARDGLSPPPPPAPTAPAAGQAPAPAPDPSAPPPSN